MSDLNQGAVGEATPQADVERPNICLDGQFTLYRLTCGQTSLHATAVPHVMVSAGGAITVEAGAHRVTAQAICVAPHVLYTVNARGMLFYVIGMDGYRAPDSCDVHPVRAVTGSALRTLIDYVDRLHRTDAHELGAMLQFADMRLSPAIEEVVRCIRATPMLRLGQHEASRLVGMERTALLKRFRRETGMTFRHYKSWAGLNTAIRLVKEGSSIADAAMDAGFADLAHFSRQCRAMTGYSPSQGTQYMERAAALERASR